MEGQGKTGSQQARAERQAEALRENLRKRKSQTRARSGADKAGPAVADRAVGDNVDDRAGGGVEERAGRPS